VAQEALVEVTRRLSSLSVPEAFPGLLRALIRKHCDRLTRRRSLAVTSLDDASAATKTGDSDPTMRHVQDAAKREMVRKAVRHLAASEREVVLLYYVGDRSQQQIADTLGLPVSTVKSRLHEARAHLRRILWPLDEEGLPDEPTTRPDRGRVVILKKKYIPEPGGKTVVKKPYLPGSG
jgi:RNA polymerase sigma-70 factor (ECF subfamily)